VGGPCLAPGGCSGILRCDSQAMELVCEPVGAAGVEICDGMDNDCDGQTDEVDDLMINEANGTPGVHDWWHDPCNEPPVGHREPPCESGKLICKNGVPKVCEGGVGPLPEVCDLKDTDCDGVADTLAACPGTNACVQGVCVEPCRGGEFPCPGGYDCQSFPDPIDATKMKSYCVPTTCNDIECPPGATCQNGSCTLDAAGGAGNVAGTGNVDDGGEPGSSGGNGTAQGGDGPGPNPGGGTDGGGSAGSSNGNAGSGATGATGEEARGIYGLVTGGGGCACRTAPVRGGAWATGLSLLLMASVFVRRRGAAKRRAA
jgi:hypothetical protein